jgi:cbb3-type cytochrome oxidase maturation protein
MNILLLLVPLSLMLLVAMISAFIWAVRNDQFEDLDTPPLEVLADRPPNEPVQLTPAEARGDER